MWPAWLSFITSCLFSTLVGRSLLTKQPRAIKSPFYTTTKQLESWAKGKKMAKWAVCFTTVFVGVLFLVSQYNVSILLFHVYSWVTYSLNSCFSSISGNSDCGNADCDCYVILMQLLWISTYFSYEFESIINNSKSALILQKKDKLRTSTDGTFILWIVEFITYYELSSLVSTVDYKKKRCRQLNVYCVQHIWCKVSRS